MIQTEVQLQIGCSADTIFSAFEEDLCRGYMEAHRHIPRSRAREKLLKDRERWLGLHRSRVAFRDRIVTAVVLDWYEPFWTYQKTHPKNTQTWTLAPEKGFVPRQYAMRELARFGCKPATLWPLLCFGHTNKDYFAGLTYNPMGVGGFVRGHNNVVFHLENVCLQFWTEPFFPRAMGIRL